MLDLVVMVPQSPALALNFYDLKGYNKVRILFIITGALLMTVRGKMSAWPAYGIPPGLSLASSHVIIILYYYIVCN